MRFFMAGGEKSKLRNCVCFFAFLRAISRWYCFVDGSKAIFSSTEMCSVSHSCPAVVSYHVFCVGHVFLGRALC